MTDAPVIIIIEIDITNIGTGIFHIAKKSQKLEINSMSETDFSSDPEALKFNCPNCGYEVKVGSPACPECGSDEKTGWSEEADDYSNDLPTGYDSENNFNYNEFVEKEFGVKPENSKIDIKNISFKILVFIVIIIFLTLIF